MRRRKARKSSRHIIIYAGQKMKSKEEVWFAQRCDESGIPWLYESEKFQWAPPFRKYTPDFSFSKKAGGKMHIENKGYLRTQDITKMRNVRKQHPDLDIRFVFSKADKPLGPVRKDGTRQTHGGWAAANGYPYAEKFLPDEWIEELEIRKGGRKKSARRY